MMSPLLNALWSMVSLLVVTSSAFGAGLHLLEAGTRVGFAGERHGEDFTQLEITAVYRLPWNWQLDNAWAIRSRLNASVGVLHSDSETGAIVTIGPSLSWINPAKRFAIEAGVNPTLLSDNEYGNADFGHKFQFTSFIGISYQTSPHVSVSARIQHMSNAGIADSNPGLNQISLAISHIY